MGKRRRYDPRIFPGNGSSPNDNRDLGDFFTWKSIWLHILSINTSGQISLNSPSGKYCILAFFCAPSRDLLVLHSGELQGLVSVYYWTNQSEDQVIQLILQFYCFQSPWR